MEGRSGCHRAVIEHHSCDEPAMKKKQPTAAAENTFAAAKKSSGY
jgi:hypothetical protein